MFPSSYCKTWRFPFLIKKRNERTQFSNLMEKLPRWNGDDCPNMEKSQDVDHWIISNSELLCLINHKRQKCTIITQNNGKVSNSFLLVSLKIASNLRFIWLLYTTRAHKNLQIMLDLEYQYCIHITNLGGFFQACGGYEKITII